MSRRPAITGIRSTVAACLVAILAVVTAQAGQMTGGGLAVVIRTGANEMHGSVFGFVRSDALRAQGALEDDDVDCSRWHAGFTVGRPIVRDRTHYFTAFEHVDEAFNLFDTSNCNVSSVDGARFYEVFDPATMQLETPANSRFGTYAATLSPREIQRGLRFVF